MPPVAVSDTINARGWCLTHFSCPSIGKKGMRYTHPKFGGIILLCILYKGTVMDTTIPLVLLF